MRSDGQRLRDIVEAIESIQRYANRGRQAFLADELVQVWVVHHLQIIGEAAARLSQQLRERHTAVRWQDVVAMRNVLVHQYFGMDPEQVWSTVVVDLPELLAQVTAILEETRFRE